MKTNTCAIKSSLLLIILLLASLNLLSQKRFDVVQLKNGNVLKGKIVRQVPGNFLEIQTLDKNFWKFDMEDITEIRYEKKRKLKFGSDSLSGNQNGVFGELKMGALVGSKSNKNNAPFSMLGTLNYRWENGFSAGIGSGIELFEETQLPLFGEIKFYKNLKELNAFIFCQSGYSFPIENRDDIYYSNNGEDINAKGGWLINPGIGLLVNGFGNSKISISLGYRYQINKLKWFNNYSDDTEYLKEKFNRLSIHLGLVF